MKTLLNVKSYLSNPSRMLKTEAMKAVLWLVKCVYFILTHPLQIVSVASDPISDIILKYAAYERGRIRVMLQNSVIDNLQ